MSKTIIESFELKLKACVREVAGKRKVFSGLWQNKEVFVKVFTHSESAKRHWKRDVEGIQKFTQAKILTPKLLWSGKFPATESICNDNAYGLIVEAVPNPESFEDLWLGSQDKAALSNKLTTVIASHHKAGLIQSDLHFGNFLLSGEKCFSLDGDALHKFDKTPISKAVNNYTLLIAQAEVIHEKLFIDAISDYCKITGFEKTEFRTLVEKTLPGIRKIRCHKLMKKIYRNCTSINSYKSPGRRSFINSKYDSPELRKCIDDPESFFPKDKSKWLKNGNSATVALIEVGGKKLVVKKYNYSKNLKTFIRRFRKSRASTSWSNAFRLINYGMKTPEPYALVETYKGPMMKYAYFIAEHLPGKCLKETIESTNDKELLKNIFSQIRDIFDIWKKCKIYHGDCKATNFILVDDKVFIIDLDAMQEFNRQENFARHHAKDLKRWMKNWAGNQELTEMLKTEFRF